MATLEDLQARIDRIAADVEKLIAALPAPVDFQPQVDQLDASIAAAENALPPEPPAEPAPPVEPTTPPPAA